MKKDIKKRYNACIVVEKSSYLNIKLPAETPVLIKQSVSSQKTQKLSETIHELSELPEPSKLNESDSDTSELHRLPMLSLLLPELDLGSEPEPSNKSSLPNLSHSKMSDLSN